ncbi:MAG: hypothetical protein ACQEWV_31575 [Bacillota bacterium]
MRCFTIRKAKGKSKQIKAVFTAALLLSLILLFLAFSARSVRRLAVNGTGTSRNVGVSRTDRGYRSI